MWRNADSKGERLAANINTNMKYIGVDYEYSDYTFLQ